jgi:hypothetical protein
MFPSEVKSGLKMRFVNPELMRVTLSRRSVSSQKRNGRMVES